MNDAEKFGLEIREHLARVDEHNTNALDETTQLTLEVCRGHGVVHAGGTGHSLALVLETFYRAGGLACVNPLYQPGLLPLHGSGPSTVLERSNGLAAKMVEQARPESRDIAFIFSNSGTNPVPVELAMRLRETGVRVVAVTSSLAAAAAPRRSSTKLDEVAGTVLDTLVPAGDVTFPAEAPVTGALSSLVSAYLWQGVLARLVEKATASDVTLPLWRSNNAPGGEEHNAQLLARYRGRVPAL